MASAGSFVSRREATKVLGASLSIGASALDPPAHAVVLSIDEKSQIQALDRTQPGCRSSRGVARP
jgi:hypothetical protein